MKKTRTLKRTLSVLLTAMMILSSLVIMPLTANAAALTGDGTEQNPYKIGSAAALLEFNSTATGTVYAELTANIDMTGVVGYKPVAGIVLNFDGNGFSISNLNCGNNDRYMGVFGQLNSPSTISNLHLKNVDVVSTAAAQDMLGLFVGYANKGFQMYNCSADADCSVVGAGGKFTGGWVGSIQGGSDARDTVFSNCVNKASVSNVSGDNGAGTGGFVGTIETIGNGANTAKLRFENCVNEGAISGYRYLGGFAGYIYRSDDIEFTNCTNSGAVTSYDYFVGGFAGRVYNRDANDLGIVLTVTKSANTGAITAGKDGYASTVISGGMFGYATHLANLEIDASVNTGTIKTITTGARALGGFIGQVAENNQSSPAGTDQTYTNSYNAGTIISETTTSSSGCFAGGLVGKMETKLKTVTVNNCANHGNIQLTGTNNGSEVLVAGFCPKVAHTYGYNKFFTVTNFYNTGAFSGTAKYASAVTAYMQFGWAASATNGIGSYGWAEYKLDHVYDYAAHTITSDNHTSITGWTSNAELARVLSNSYGVKTANMKLTHAANATIITADGTKTATNCAVGCGLNAGMYPLYYNLDVVDTATTPIDLCKQVDGEWVFDRTSTISAEIARIAADIQAAMNNTDIVKEAAENLSIEPGNLEIRLRLVEPFGFMAITSLKDDESQMLAYNVYTSVAEVGFAFLNGNEDDANTVLTTGQKVQGAKYNDTEKFYATFEELLASKLKDTISFVAYVTIDDTTYVSGVRTIVVYNEVVDCCDGMYGTSVAIPEAEKKVYVAMKEYADAYYDYLGK